MAAPYHYSQYPPSQQYPQSQQYQQAQQYQQPQPQQQSYGNNHSGYQQQQQHPSLQSPQERYTPQNYQQQYSPQQYSPQQYAQQQYPQSQHPSQQYAVMGHPSQQYRPPYQSTYQSSQGSYGQAAAQVPSQSCFNCGTLGHFAQDCPEPKRQVPAGALNPGQHRRQGIAPSKRGGQIVTKFGSHGSSIQGSPGTYTPAYSSGGYPQYPQPHSQTYTPVYTPTTPQAAPSPAQNWPPQQQRAPQYQQYQQPQSNGYYPAPPTPQQSWPTPSTPAPAAPFGSSQTIQASPPQSQRDFPMKPQYNQYGEAQATSVQGAHQTPASTQQPGHDLESALRDIQALQTRQADDDRAAAADPEASPPILHTVASKEDDFNESEEDDLTLLDVPDLPPSTAQYGGAVVPLVGMPIPANFVVADALFPMEPPSPEAEGRCQSKYVRSLQADALLQNIRDSTYWKDLKEDVIFSSISTDGDYISLDECRSKTKERQRPLEEILRESRSESRSAAPRKEAAEAAKSLEQLQRALEQAKSDIANREKRLKEKKGLRSLSDTQPSIKDEELLVKAEPMSPPQSATVENGSGYRDESEDLLASLGVTGTAKPIGPPTRLVSQNSSRYGEAKSRSRSASRPENTEHCANAPYPDCQQTNPYPNGYAQHPQNPQHHALPPPPPPAFHQHAYGQPPSSDGEHRSPPAAGVNPFGYRPNNTENECGAHRYQTDNLSPYYPQMRPESAGTRKRGYDERSSSEESEEAARRQEDDITPKLKRRQPKVAEAYSRRW